jgi:hypothetical protein
MGEETQGNPGQFLVLPITRVNNYVLLPDVRVTEL